jgi:TfoX/Sxy family transcriptional regulator of competence genes
MAYDEALDEKITAATQGWGTTSKKMFGGVCHLINGNMMCGVHKDSLILRLGEAQATAALDGPYARPMDITGRPMKGWVMVEGAGLEEPHLSDWLDQARAFAGALPPK